MNANPGWHNVARIVWMAGGVAAISEPGPAVKVCAGVGGLTICEFRLVAYGGLFEALRQRGFQIIGTTFVVDPDEVEGLRPPEFRVAGPGVGWLLWDVRRQWREIAVTGGKNENMRLLDIAARIASGLLYSQMRVGDLAAAYSAQLRGYLHRDEAKEYQAFQDLSSFDVYKAIHALFWEMAVLRDALAEFAAVFCFLRPEVRPLKGLLKSLRLEPSEDPLAGEILRATDPSGGWLATFTNYRNCFTHAAPMEQAANIAMAVQDLRRLPDGMKIPQIYYPLPQNVEELLRKRSRGALFSSTKELLSASARQHERASEPDALEYLHSCLNKLTALANALVARSPLPPTATHITEGDIIGGVRVTISPGRRKG